MEKISNISSINEIILKYNNDYTKLIPILQEVQDEYRYLPEDVMKYVASKLNIAPARLFGVASFYSHFTLTPKGKYVIKVCDGTACHVKKSTRILNAMRDYLALPDGKITSDDMLFTVETVSCLGTCGLAPAIMVNDKIYGLLDETKVVRILDDIKENEVAINE